MLTKRAAVLFAVLFAFSALAEDVPWTITPSHGLTPGGTVVTITGPLGDWPYGVIFGGVGALSTERIDKNTLRAVTPPHLPGEVEVSLFEYDLGVPTPLKFTYMGEVPAAYVRLLLPVFVPPVQGAFGSEFRTEVRATAIDNTYVELWGVHERCPIIECTGQEDRVTVRSYFDMELAPNGTPGRFAYVPRTQLSSLFMTLRAFDVSREATNYGTALPIVNWETAARAEIRLPAIPTDPRFRSTLRIYSDVATPALVTVASSAGVEVQRDIRLTGAATTYEPAMFTWTEFPTDVGPVRVTIRPQEGVKVWALVTVTNNDTQAITTITPQP
jgi:hypothetical protein